MDRKAAKEAFVSGLSGAPASEVFALVGTLSLLVVICEGVKALARSHGRRLGLVLELGIVVGMHLLLATEALPLWPIFSTCMVVASSFLMIAARGGLPPPAGATVEALAGPRKSFLSVFRGALLCATCVAILAVDFRAFPRRYAKAESYGTGYMDVGVGGVVFAAGLVSRTALPPAEGGAPWPPPPLRQRLVSALRGSAACWALALVRLVSTRAVDYQVPVGEYGTHWNFFATIAVVAAVAGVVAVPPDRLLTAAISATLLHQAALSYGGLGAWAVSPERGPDLASLNKEGLASAAGFVALHLWGQALGALLHASLQQPAAVIREAAARGSAGVKAHGRQGEARAGAWSVAYGAVLSWALRLAASNAVLWAAVAMWTAAGERVSRRTCNAPYILWIAAQCHAAILPLALWQAVLTAARALQAVGDKQAAGAVQVAAAAGRGKAEVAEAATQESTQGSTGAGDAVGPRVLLAINRNPLPVFLAANLLTGAVNLRIDTMQVSDWPARAIVGAYMALVCGAALALESRGWRLRL
ncbi:hypothetical protein HYH03_004836 [Edaphochlamys debaryana]|uniref:GPI-anchored wall transfer protein n=1 Tax=Edaphochlamys debaryana TaxID=47281 RepID=A0A835Y6J6_9CHLO|nr:hypothetical protein HYH03_004836 [Edaphochlamys debaryana]|eukprot:KAG2497252.1 hypothetical protein HYH03_004836 [Edaphochlamys debaryana]